MEKVFAIILLVISAAATATEIPAPMGNDVTEEFHAIWQNPDIGWNHESLAALRTYKIIIVPGFMARPAVHMHKFMNETLQWLQANSVNAEIIDVAPMGTPEQNGQTIMTAVEHSPLPALIIADSKGGIDFVAGILARQNLMSKVKGIISLQVPYYGTPLADLVDSNSLLTNGLNLIFSRWGGTEQALHSLRTDIRSVYMEQYHSEMQMLLQRIPIVAIACWKNPVPGKWDTLFKQTRDYMYYRLRLENDGLVPWKSEVYPGSDFVKIEGLDHLTTTGNSGFITFDRTRFSKTIVYMLLLRVHGF